jgi:hypothetical protein
MLHTTSTAWPAVADDTRDALAQIGGNDSLLSDEWRVWLREALASLERVGDDETGVLAVRAARAAAVIAAVESAQAARFEARLMAVAPGELDCLQSALDARRIVLEEAQALSTAHLDSGIRDLMAEFRAQVALESRGASAAGYRHLLGGDVSRMVHDHRDRSEELLLELGDAACSLVGVAMGGLLPLRAAHVAPMVDIGDEIPAAQLEGVVDAMVASYCDRLSAQLPSVGHRLQATIDRARHWQSLGHDAASEHAGVLCGEAHELDALAQRLGPEA